MTSTMALSLLQDAQTRGLAAALAGMKREEQDRSLTISPPNSNSSPQTHLQQTPLYPGLNSAAAAASAFRMLSPTQLLAANRQAAAAFMAAQLPMSNLASISSLFPHHPALFSAWPGPSTHHSPPSSPISPILNQKKHSMNNNNTQMINNNLLSSVDNHAPVAKKTRKISVKKDLMSPPIEIPMTPTSDLFNTQNGPISPPSSGSSPNSQQDGPVTAIHHKDPSKDKSFTCKICNRSFGYKHVLQNHERTHTGEKPFECAECHKRFTRDHHLKTHMRLHTGEKPYHCSHCDRQFVQVANLRRHLRVHTGERPYKCEMCEAHFSDSNQLKSHQLVHNGEKPFECERCHLKFRRRHHLMHHKCGIPGSLQSPPTPAISPSMSDYGIELKSTISSFNGSDESMELIKHDEMLPLDLSEETATDVYEKRSRKTSDIRRVLRMPQPLLPQIPTEIPEQTEPEDLSVHRGAMHSPISSHHDDDLEDLDDAATLAMKQRQKMIQAAVQQMQHHTPKRHLNMDME